MNSMDIKLVIDIVTASCTILTLVIIYLTLLEMKTQRLKIFEPHILPINSKFYVFFENDVLKNELHFGIANNEKEVSKFSNDNPYLKFINVGHGIAKDISVNISYGINYHSYFEFLKTGLENIYSQIKVDISQGSCWIEKRDKNEIEYLSSFPFELSSEINSDYILPIKDNDEYLKIELPTSIISAISLTLFLYQNRFNKRPNELLEKIIDELNINISIKYKDNLNKSYFKKFKIVLDLPKVKVDGISGGMIYSLNLNRENKYFS